MAPVLVMATIALWALAYVVTSSGQWGDHLEQFVWAHGVEWGYHKHPPLPTWMLAAAIAAFGPSIYWADALGAVCFFGTSWFTWAIARDLLGRPTAALALLMLSLGHSFTARASLFNHNSVMLLTVSGTAWCVISALKPGRHGVAWCLAGIAAALAVLSKYQALVPLAGIVLGAWWAGELAAKRARRGLALSIAIAAILLAPHFVWLASHVAALEYATQMGRSLNAAERTWNVCSFLAQQLRFLIGPFLLFGLLAVAPGRRPDVNTGDEHRQRAWLVGLIAFPLCVTVLTGPLFGIELQNHWGYQALQFVSVWLARRLRPIAPVAGARWIFIALAVHAVLLTLSIADAESPAGNVKSRVDGRYPAQAFADAVLADWKHDTPCPLRLVVGPSFEAGVVSVYNGGTAQVLEGGNRMKSPWVAPTALERLGAVYVAADPSTLPNKGVTTVNWMNVGVATPQGAPSRIYWAIAPPQSCDVP
ncbi:MAG: glycosyltransferase family 39 protein [Caldimonas sp.]